MSDLLVRVREDIRRSRMLSPGDVVIAAVSGGADSVVMLHLLWRMREEMELKIIVAHLDHGLRGRESRRDYLFTEGLAKGLGLRFEGGRLKPGELKRLPGSPQEAAREKRYEFLERAAADNEAARIALGHTLDDQAETVLMRLLKGASLSGLAGIPAKRDKYIRPLLSISRKEIEEYAAAEGLSFVIDSTNLERKYLRNRIRLDLIPVLQREYNPNIRETLSRTAALLRADDEYIEKAAKRAFRSACIEARHHSITLDRLKLLSAHGAIISRVFLLAGRSLGKEGLELGSAHVEAFMDMAKGKKPNASIALPFGIRAERVYDRVVVTAEAAREAAGFEAVINVPGRTVIEGIGEFRAELKKPRAGGLKEGEAVAWFDLKALSTGPLIARRARPGDRLAPFGMKGRRKLKDLFIDMKIPPGERRRTPVVFSGDDIIWVAGLRRSGLYRVEKGAPKALRVEFIPA
ncbi:MAG: tRNA lysidine(34) synthetase TilS [Thermodesulfobacteriota bacterium]|nr:MAG: tRNA lysidine(34) synthetase TilS [Thermodesulfobacteriota bacterium]